MCLLKLASPNSDLDKECGGIEGRGAGRGDGLANTTAFGDSFQPSPESLGGRLHVS